LLVLLHSQLLLLLLVTLAYGVLSCSTAPSLLHLQLLSLPSLDCTHQTATSLWAIFVARHVD
jgi:hypothetical protein